jgi:hypothetical protein
MTRPVWAPHKDPASIAWGIRKLIGSTPRYKRIWNTRNPPLDQGQEGACTAYASASAMAAAPAKWETDAPFAERLFKLTEEIDIKEGRNYYGRGATLLASMKAGVKLGYYDSFYWCFGIDDVIDCIVRQGPVLLGIPWYESMSTPDANGLIPEPYGKPEGHCIMANGYWPGHPDFKDVAVLTNTWGLDWGLRGRAYIKIGMLKELLQEGGEAVKPHDVRVQPRSSNGEW